MESIVTDIYRSHADCHDGVLVTVPSVCRATAEAIGYHGKYNTPINHSPMTTSPAQHILLVDDEKFIRQLYADVLTDAGYRVDTAEDGAAGWEKLQDANFDLLITDNNMPRVSGVQLIKKIQAANKLLPIIMATATPPENLEELKLSGLLAKPFGMDELLQVVEETLHQKWQNLTAAKM